MNWWKSNWNASNWYASNWFHGSTGGILWGSSGDYIEEHFTNEWWDRRRKKKENDDRIAILLSLLEP